MTKKAQLLQTIHVIAQCGRGTPDSPHREVVEFWSTDGKLSAYNDPAERQAVIEILTILADKQLDAAVKVERCQVKAGILERLLRA